MELNYDRLILGSDVPINENVSIHIPTIRELAEGQYNEFMLFTRVFVTSVREQFSSMPSEVDKIEEEFPTFWELAFNDNMNVSVGQTMFGEGIDLLSVIVNGFAYWTKTKPEQYKVLSNNKIISEDLNWIIDSQEFQKFSDYIKMITLSEPNEDLIAPKGMASKPNRCKLWLTLYKGRIRKLQKQKSKSLGDRLLLLEAVAPSYLSFSDIGDLNYYQFQNLLSAYSKRYQNDREFAIYTAYKFDTSKMKMTDLSEDVAMVKLKK